MREYLEQKVGAFVGVDEIQFTRAAAGLAGTHRGFGEVRCEEQVIYLDRPSPALRIAVRRG